MSNNKSDNSLARGMLALVFLILCLLDLVFVMTDNPLQIRLFINSLKLVIAGWCSISALTEDHIGLSLLWLLNVAVSLMPLIFIITTLLLKAQ